MSSRLSTSAELISFNISSEKIQEKILKSMQKVDNGRTGTSQVQWRRFAFFDKEVVDENIEKVLVSSSSSISVESILV